MRWWIAILAACSPPPTLSLVVAPEQGTVPPIASLARLRLIIRTCDSNEPALAENIPIRGGADPIEAPVIPGTTFYAWIQGWEECNPPCKLESEARDDDCTCVQDAVPPAQVFKYEGCTDWIESPDDDRRTLPFAPKSNPRLCPPSMDRVVCKTPNP
jgi:hypothetical protein